MKIRESLGLITIIAILLILSLSCGGKKPPELEPEEAKIKGPGEIEEIEPKVTGWETGKVEKKELTPSDYSEIGVLEDIHFDFDKYDIRPDAREILIKNAEWLKENQNVKILIEGHCDERGTNEYNMALGERRANSTKNYIISLGISAYRIKIISYGEEIPIDPGHNEIAWDKNRRAHFLITSKE